MKNYASLVAFVCVAALATSYSSSAKEAARSAHAIVKRAVTGAHVLSEKQKKMILDKHNEMRASVEPKASNMLKMKWNNTMEEIATTYSRRCIYEHNYGPGMEIYGENLYLTTAAVDDQFAINGMVAWFDERLDYNYETEACSNVCGHYTALVWAESDMVGCGISTCDVIDVNGTPWNGASLLVCNYHPAGNVQGRTLYEKGDWCSKCPDGYHCDDKLCSLSSSTRALPTWAASITVLIIGLSWQWIIDVY